MLNKTSYSILICSILNSLSLEKGELTLDSGILLSVLISFFSTLNEELIEYNFIYCSIVTKYSHWSWPSNFKCRINCHQHMESNCVVTLLCNWSCIFRISWLAMLFITVVNFGLVYCIYDINLHVMQLFLSPWSCIFQFIPLAKQPNLASAC